MSEQDDVDGGPVFVRDEENKECAADKNEGKQRFEQMYRVNWDKKIGNGCLGNIYCGTCTSDGTEVVITTLAASAKFENFSDFAKGRFKMLQQRWPNVIQLLGGYRAVFNDVVNIIYVMKLHGVSDIKSVFASVESQENLFEKDDGRVIWLDAHAVGELLQEAATEEKEEEKKKKKKKEGGREGEVEKVRDGDSSSGISNKTVTQLQKASFFSAINGKVLTIGCYEVDMNDVIGKGRFGTVYRGRHIHEGFKVAVKIVCGPVSKSHKLLIEAEELKNLQDLNHPNILCLHKSFKKICDEGIVVVLVLEFCRGGDLREFLAKHDSLSEQQVRRIMKQLVQLLSVMKKNRVMHRDLKPANILLTTTNIDEAVLKVADWGMAKRSGTSASASASGGGCCGGCCVGNGMFESTVGTVAYMSPERLACDFYDFQAEVWALGVIMYELIFARHPYLHNGSSVRTPVQLLEAITRAQEVDLAANAPCTKANEEVDMVTGQQQCATVGSLSSDCYDLMRCMLDSNPTSRYTIEQVETHPWFFKKESLYATEEVKAIEKPFEEAGPTGAAEATGAIEVAKNTSFAAGAALLPAWTAVATQRFFNAEDYVIGGVTARSRGSACLASHRQQIICEALRQYIHILRYNVIEEEVDPGRGLVLLSYAWDIYCTAMKALWAEEHALDESTLAPDATTTAALEGAWPVFRLCLPEDIRRMETYIQETSGRLKRNLPAIMTNRPLGAHVINFSTASMPGSDTPNESFSQSEGKPSGTTYPTAHNLIFQRVISLIRIATSEALMLCGTDDEENVTMMINAHSDGEKCRQQQMYEQAISILRLFLQQIVIRKQAVASSLSLTNTTDTEEAFPIQVLTVPLVQAKEEADQRTAQALLHTVEKYYRRLVKIK